MWKEVIFFVEAAWKENPLYLRHLYYGIKSLLFLLPLGQSLSLTRKSERGREKFVTQSRVCVFVGEDKKIPRPLSSRLGSITLMGVTFKASRSGRKEGVKKLAMCREEEEEEDGDMEGDSAKGTGRVCRGETRS